MCGIAGIISKKQPLENAGKQILEMTTSIRHRGPDDEGYLALNEAFETKRLVGEDTNEDIRLQYPGQDIRQFQQACQLVFGYRRLSIIDLTAGGHQPMCTFDENIWVVFNGEIYNYLTLKKELQSLGENFYSLSDTEVFLAAYKHFGLSFLDKLDGMWAFALLDLKQRKVFFAVDRTGVKPFYFLQNEQYFAFASEIKALKKLQPNLRVNEAVALNYMLHGKLDYGNETFYLEVRKLAGGELMEFDLESKSIQTKTYYKLPQESEKYKDWKENEILEKIETLVGNSITMHGVTEVPVGVALSGGLDSSIVLGRLFDFFTLFNSFKPDPYLDDFKTEFKVYTIFFNGFSDNELKYAEKVVKGKGLKWMLLSPTLESLKIELPDLIRTFETPFLGLSSYAHYLLASAAASYGTKVLLEGQGADELFAGYGKHVDAYLFELFMHGKFWEMQQALKQLPGIHPFHWAKIALKNRLSAASKSFHPISPYLKSDFLGAYKPENQSGYEFTGSLNETLRKDYTNGMLQFLLRAGDKTSMRFSIETRVPFADSKDLMEFVMLQSSNLKLKNGTYKYLLRESNKNWIPKEIYERKDKIGFAVPQTDWLKGLKDEIFQYHTGKANAFIDVEKMRKDWHKNLDKGQSWDVRLWRLSNFMIWLEMD